MCKNWPSSRLYLTYLSFVYISFSNKILNYITYILWLFLKLRVKLDIVFVTAQNSKHPQILATMPYFVFTLSLTTFFKYCLPILCDDFWLVWSFTSQSTIFQLCQDGSFWVEPVLDKDKCVLLKDKTQWCQWGSNPHAFGLESITLPLSHCAPFMCWFKKTNQCRSVLFVL